MTAPNTKLFAIRLDIAKTTSMNIECIIFITDSLDFARKAVDTSVYSKQAYFSLYLNCSSLVALIIRSNSGTI